MREKNGWVISTVALQIKNESNEENHLYKTASMSDNEYADSHYDDPTLLYQDDYDEIIGYSFYDLTVHADAEDKNASELTISDPIDLTREDYDFMYVTEDGTPDNPIDLECEVHRYPFWQQSHVILDPDVSINFPVHEYSGTYPPSWTISYFTQQ